MRSSSSHPELHEVKAQPVSSEEDLGPGAADNSRPRIWAATMPDVGEYRPKWLKLKNSWQQTLAESPACAGGNGGAGRPILYSTLVSLQSKRGPREGISYLRSHSKIQTST